MRVQEVAEEIAAGKFPAKPGYHCAFCPYRNLCPATEKVCYVPQKKAAQSRIELEVGRAALRSASETICHKKLWGRSSRPLCRCLLQLLSAFCCFSSLLSFWLPWIYSPFPFFMEFRNGVLLQLVECIESTQNEVKRKMIETRRMQRCTKVTCISRARKKFAYCSRNFIAFEFFATVRLASSHRDHKTSARRSHALE